MSVLLFDSFYGEINSGLQERFDSWVTFDKKKIKKHMGSSLTGTDYCLCVSFQQKDIRIIIGNFDEEMARKVFCAVSIQYNLPGIWTRNIGRDLNLSHEWILRIVLFLFSMYRYDQFPRTTYFQYTANSHFQMKLKCISKYQQFHLNIISNGKLLPNLMFGLSMSVIHYQLQIPFNLLLMV